MQVYKLGSFPIEQQPDYERLELRLAEWFVGREYPVRMLAFSQGFDLSLPIERLQHSRHPLHERQQTIRPLLQAIDRLLRGEQFSIIEETIRRMSARQISLVQDLLKNQPALYAALAGVAGGESQIAPATWQAIYAELASPLWSLPFLKEQERFYETLQRGFIRSATYTMLTWEPADVQGRAIAATLSQACGRPAELLDTLPTLLRGPYREELTLLRPTQPGQPWLTTLMAYDARADWDATILHELLSVPYDIAIAVDVTTLSRHTAMRAAELAFNNARGQVNSSGLKDTLAERVLVDSERVMHALNRERLHDVQIAVLVSAESVEQLEIHVAQVRDMLGSRLLLLRPHGVQGELLKLWSTTPATQIDLPWKRRTILSHGVGCLMGMIGYHRPANTSGLLWGLDAVRRAPLFYDLFARNQAAHMVVLGKSGFGKTVFLNVTTLRAAALLGYRVICIDAFRNAARLEHAAQAGAHINWIGIESAINILDVVFDLHTEAEGGWIASQVQHTISQLALLLGTPGIAADGKRRYTARELTIGERGVLDLALCRLYATVNPAGQPADMPVLTDLIAILDTIAEPEALALAQQISKLICGVSERGAPLNMLGRRFSAPTTIDWDFSADINCFDFSAVPEDLIPFYYAQAVGAINRYMRDPARDLQRKTLLVIDEFGYAAQVESVGRLAANICKVARKYAIGLIAVDQNPATFLGNLTGREIFENAAAKILFHLDDLPAREIGSAIGDLTPGHVEWLSDAQPGQCVGVFGNDVYIMNIELHPLEQRYLMGS